MPNDDADSEAKVVAFLLSEGWSARQIQDRLVLTETTYRRRRRKAVDNDWLQQHCHLSIDELRGFQSEYQEYPYDDVERVLIDRAESSGIPCPKVVILESGSEATTPDEYDERLERIAIAAAPRVVDWLTSPDSKLIGVTYGKALFKLVNRIRGLHPKRLSDREDLRFVPLCGVLSGDPNIRFSSSLLAAELHRVLQTSTRPLSLGIVPSWLPRKYHAKKQIEEFLNDAADYGRVFGGKKPIVNELDAVFTSVGSGYGSSSDPWIEDICKNESFTREDLADASYGDIAGYFLIRSDAGRSISDRIGEVNDRRKGITGDQFRNCAETARRNKSIGVTIIAVGKAKAGVVLECVRLGYANRLVIDLDLATAIASR